MKERLTVADLKDKLVVKAVRNTRRMDQKESDGRTLRINEAQPRRQDRRDSSPRGGGGGGRDGW